MKQRQRKKNAGFCLAVMLACVLAAAACMGCGTEKKKSDDTEEVRPKIIIGSDNYPPFNSEDANGKAAGIDVDLANEAFGRMGYEAEFVYIDWEDKKQLLESGVIDCIWCSFSIDGREDQYRWTIPYMYSHQVIAVSKNSDIYTLQDLKGKRIAVQSTTKPEEIFASHTDERIPELAEVFSLQNRELLYPFLSKGYADAIAAHETSIVQCTKDYDLDFRILEEPLLTVGLGVAFDRSDTRGLEQELTHVLEEMREDGTTEQILGTYLDHPEHYLEADTDEN